MRSSYARVMYGVQASKGTEAASYSALGIVDRPHTEIDAGVERLYSVGDRNPMQLSEGLTLANVGLSIVALQNFDFLSHARVDDTSGELDWLSIKWGYTKGSHNLTVTVIDCKIDNFTLRCEAGGRVEVDAALIGGKVTKVASSPGAMPTLSEQAYRWFELQWDEVRDLLSFEMTVRNNLNAQPVIAGSGTTRDPERIWDYLDEGQNEVEGTLAYFLGDANVDLQDCLVSEADHTLTLASCSDISPAQSATITLSDLKLTSEDHQANVGANIVVQTPFMATDWQVSES